MGTSSNMIWLFALSKGLPFLFYIAALIFVVRQQIDRGSAKTYLVFGLSLLLFQIVSGEVAGFVIVRFISPDNLTGLAVSSLLFSLLHVVAIAFLIAAAVAVRFRAESEQRFVSPANDNPYTPPQS
uniref:Hypothetical membrane protein n=1 Tax=uncultured planctomycete 13FN TaxID=455065 RepID=A9LH65_9BACT|nr:hypothetical membrane protein [uncultured planctomycete 13FN]